MDLHSPDEPVYVISVVARLVGMPTHTLRLVERQGLITPSRTERNIRLYSDNDVKRLQRICTLMKVHGVNWAGVKLLLTMEESQQNQSTERGF